MPHSLALLLAVALAHVAPGWAFTPLASLSSSRALPGLCFRPHAAGPRHQRDVPLTMQLEENSKAARSSARHTLAPFVPVLMTVLLPSVAGAEPPEWLEDTRSSLDIGLALFSLLFFLRIPLTWYPQMDLKKMPQAVVAIPTEPFCALVRKVTPPLFGVDISPIVLYAILSFIREIFLGQQGVLTMMADK